MAERVVDGDLDADLVSGLIGAQFPGFAGLEVSRFGARWDHELFSVGNEWILRFPRRAERVPWLTREIEIMTVTAETLGGMVPRFEWVGSPSEWFPYPFVGYRRLVGVGADQVLRGDLAGLAGDVGRLLGRLHRISPERIPATPAGWELEPWMSCEATSSASPTSFARCSAQGCWLTRNRISLGAFARPPQNGPLRFIHNDICPDHVIVGAHSGRLVGVIDFTAAMIGDPVLDLVGLIGIGGYRFIDQVIAPTTFRSANIFLRDSSG